MVDTFIGGKIASYEILKVLGEGGMGTVYLGMNPQIQAKVAIKVLHAKLANKESVVHRFLDEARAVNRIGHPGIIQIHDSGRSDDGRVYLVMEYLKGESLQQRLEAQLKLPTDAVIRIMCQSASALSACHEAGIIHRDLKPSNIFLSPDPDMPGGERAKILDFGIAKLEAPGEEQGLTLTGAVLGSPNYMSHEQALDSAHVDHRTDIYSLAAVGYVLLTGHLPYQVENFLQLVKAQATAPARPLHVSGVQASPALEQVFATALAADREKRYASMTELRDALLAAQAAEQPAPVPASAPVLSGLPAGAEGGDSMATFKVLNRDEAMRRANTPLILAIIAVLALGVMALPLLRKEQSPDEAVAAAKAPALPAAALAKQPPPPPAKVASAGTEPVEPKEAPPAQEPPPPAKEAPQAPDEPPAPPADKMPAVVFIKLKLTPADAEITLNGKPRKGPVLGFPTDGKKRLVRVTAPGYLPFKQVMKPRANGTLEVTLKKKPPSNKTRPKKKGTGKKKSLFYKDL